MELCWREEGVDEAEWVLFGEQHSASFEEAHPGMLSIEKILKKDLADFSRNKVPHVNLGPNESARAQDVDESTQER